MRGIVTKMFKLPVFRPGDENLFEVILEPTAPVIGKLVKEVGEGEITTVLGKRNKVAVGVPYYENFISRLVEEKEEIPREIEKMSENYDFHFVSLSCSFLPDNNCRFVWARFGVELSARSKSGKALDEKPIAYYMFPDEVLSAVRYKRVVNLESGLKLDLNVVNAGIESGSGESSDFVVYEPQIFAFGIRRSNVAWDFKSTKEKGIWGNKTDLIQVVHAPKNSKVKGRFLLGAEVEVVIGKQRPIRVPLSKRRDDRIVDAEYDLSG